MHVAPCMAPSPSLKAVQHLPALKVPQLQAAAGAPHQHLVQVRVGVRHAGGRTQGLT